MTKVKFLESIKVPFLAVALTLYVPEVVKL